MDFIQILTRLFEMALSLLRFFAGLWKPSDGSFPRKSRNEKAQQSIKTKVDEKEETRKDINVSNEKSNQLKKHKEESDTAGQGSQFGELRSESGMVTEQKTRELYSVAQGYDLDYSHCVCDCEHHDEIPSELKAAHRHHHHNDEIDDNEIDNVLIDDDGNVIHTKRKHKKKRDKPKKNIKLKPRKTSDDDEDDYNDGRKKDMNTIITSDRGADADIEDADDSRNGKRENSTKEASDNDNDNGNENENKNDKNEDNNDDDDDEDEDDDDSNSEEGIRSPSHTPEEIVKYSFLSPVIGPNKVGLDLNSDDNDANNNSNQSGASGTSENETDNDNQIESNKNNGNNSGGTTSGAVTNNEEEEVDDDDADDNGNDFCNQLSTRDSLNDDDDDDDEDDHYNAKNGIKGKKESKGMNTMNKKTGNEIGNEKKENGNEDNRNGNGNENGDGNGEKKMNERIEKSELNNGLSLKEKENMVQEEIDETRMHSTRSDGSDSGSKDTHRSSKSHSNFSSKRQRKNTNDSSNNASSGIVNGKARKNQLSKNNITKLKRRKNSKENEDSKENGNANGNGNGNTNSGNNNDNNIYNEINSNGPTINEIIAVATKDDIKFEKLKNKRRKLRNVRGRRSQYALKSSLRGNSKKAKSPSRSETCWSHIPSMEGDILKQYVFNHLGSLNGLTRKQRLINGFVHNQDVFKNRKQPWLIYLAGPSGAGKSYARDHFFQKAFKEEFYHSVKVFPDFIRPMLEKYNFLMEKVNQCGCKQHLAKISETQSTSINDSNDNNNGEKEKKYTYYDLLAELMPELIETSHEIMFTAMKYNCHITREASLKSATWYKQEFVGTREKYPKYKIALFYVFPMSKELLKNQLENRNNSQERQVLVDSALHMYDMSQKLLNETYLKAAEIVIKALNPGYNKTDQDWKFEIYTNGILKKTITGDVFLRQYCNNIATNDSNGSDGSDGSNGIRSIDEHDQPDNPGLTVLFNE